MKGEWCTRNPNVFCQEDSGCDNCTVPYPAQTPQEICPKIDTCSKIQIVMDKDMPDFLRAQVIREVCEICKTKGEDK